MALFSDSKLINKGWKWKYPLHPPHPHPLLPATKINKKLHVSHYNVLMNEISASNVREKYNHFPVV